MKLMKLFAVLALMSISSVAFGYRVLVRNRSTQNANVTLTFGGAGGQLNWLVVPMMAQAQNIENFPLQSVHINGVDMDYNAPATAAIRNISFEITEDVAGNLNLNEAQ